MPVPLPFVHDDGGRAAAGYRGTTGDCTVRAFAIAGQLDYRHVYESLAAIARLQADAARTARRRKALDRSPRVGVHMATIRAFAELCGFTWTPTMSIGSGTTVHLAVGELPDRGRLVVRCSRHLVAVVDGVVHDNHDPARDGTRAVYGYWTAP